MDDMTSPIRFGEVKWPSSDFMAIGGQKACQAYLVELIAVVSTLFTECQYLTWFQRYDQFNFLGSWLYIGNRGVIFDDFFTIFCL